MAGNSQLKQFSSTNQFTRIWWWTFMLWFEENVKTGPIPNGFDLPFAKCTNYFLLYTASSRIFIKKTKTNYVKNKNSG